MDQEPNTVELFREEVIRLSGEEHRVNGELDALMKKLDAERTISLSYSIQSVYRDPALQVSDAPDNPSELNALFSGTDEKSVNFREEYIRIGRERIKRLEALRDEFSK